MALPRRIRHNGQLYVRADIDKPFDDKMTKLLDVVREIKTATARLEYEVDYSRHKNRDAEVRVKGVEEMQGYLATIRDNAALLTAELIKESRRQAKIVKELEDEFDEWSRKRSVD